MDTPDHESIVHGANHQSPESAQEVVMVEEETILEGDQVTPKKSGRKRRRDVTEAKEIKKKKTSPTASTVDRPSRERKSVVRFAATAPRIMPAAKGVKIEEGSGEKLKDIPNVTFKLSKRRTDENLRALHKILFGRKTNAHYLKRNILQFSGFAWSQNKEKDRSKVREKLNKCNKDRLLDFCELLDVYTLKTTTKKEEVAAKLLEFLESPHATREVVLSEKPTKGKKRRRVVKGNGVKRVHEDASSDKDKLTRKTPHMHGTHKAPKKTVKSHKEEFAKDSSVNGDNESEDKEDTADLSRSEEGDGDDEHEASESSESQSDGESDGDEMTDRDKPKSEEKALAGKKAAQIKSNKESTPSPLKNNSAGDKTKGKVSFKDKPSKEIKGSLNSEKKRPSALKDSKKNSSIRSSSQKKGDAGSNSRDLPIKAKKSKEKGKTELKSSPKEKKRKLNFESPSKEEKQNLRTVSKNMKDGKKQISQAKKKHATGKRNGKQEDALDEPSTEQLHSVASGILKEVDFNVATLADIIKQLGAHFNADLMHRKTEIKSILEEMINNMTDEEEEEDGGADVGATGEE